MEQVGVLNPKRIEQARLKANLSQSDLAHEIRRLSAGHFKPNEGAIRKWSNGTHKPSDGVVVVIAKATGHEIEFFYTADSDDDEDEAALRRELQQLPVDLRRRIERALERKVVQA